MNAKYYEYVTEKKKKIKKSGRSRTYNLEFVNQLLYHLHHRIPLLEIKSFITKLNHTQKHTTSKCWGSDGNLGPLDFQSSSLPLEPC
jgi:hypothetical protein